MAGAYLDLPSRRMAWDVDGSIALTINAIAGSGPAVGGHGAQVFIERLTADKQKSNNESQSDWMFSGGNSGNNQGYSMMALLFPELREIEGLYVNVVPSGINNGWVAVSGNTTNAIDGSWTDLTHTITTAADYTDYRASITSYAQSSVIGIKMNAGGSGTSAVNKWTRVHVYGVISPGQTPDRLLMIDNATGLEFNVGAAPEVMDWGDAGRGRAAEWQFNVKNNSTVAGNNLTANTVQMTHEDLYLGAGGWTTFSDDGSAFSATLAITSIAPEAQSVKMYARQIIPATTAPGPFASRTKFTVSSWT